ncbi:hypothetical protein CANARDRAFT_25771 [[Candida] arabinofermentans NRRL YB-2248]|uniref:Uncharacterized protein n=1 Tax=[Candida] arabinofermentans NRRL YB-2248 TaxID=983967 RepID=A0A1E4SSU3_9ASCO|nr:hypothetical protein CANARDRAFT_25771 [[Candida] arabinofermentans NRRL YB-2248]
MFSLSIISIIISLLHLMTTAWSYEFSDFELLATWDTDYKLKVPTNISVNFDVLSETIEAALGDVSQLKCDINGAKKRVTDHVLSDLLENHNFREVSKVVNNEGQNIISYHGAVKKSSSNPMWYDYGWSLVSSIVKLFVGDMIDCSLHYFGLIRSKCPSAIYVAHGVIIHIDRYTFSPNCGSVPTIDSLVGIIEKSIKEAEDKSMVGWCITIDHSGSHTSEIKFMHQSLAAALSFSEMVCPPRAELIRDEL